MRENAKYPNAAMLRHAWIFRCISDFDVIFDWLFSHDFSKIAAFQQFFKFPFN